MMRGKRNLTRIVASVAVVALLLSGGLYLGLKPGGKTITAYFSSATALYEGNPVNVLGVAVGTVTSVRPQPHRVAVEMRIDDGVEIPAEVHAVQVSPSLISGRFVVLTPPYSGGPTLAHGAVIPAKRTRVPLDIDDLYDNVNKLAKTLGPEGANKDGALSRSLNVLAENLDGHGKQIAKTIKKLAEGTSVLAGSRKELFGTVRKLQTFIDTLAQNDGDVHRLTQQLATVSGFLADNRKDLGAALHELSTALDDVTGFIHSNRSALKSNVDKLSKVTKVLVEQRKELGKIIDEAPLGLGNLLAAYNASSGTLDVRLAINELRTPPLLLVCKLVGRSTPSALPDVVSNACAKLGKSVDGALNPPSVAEVVRSIERGEVPLVPGIVVAQDTGGGS